MSSILELINSHSELTLVSRSIQIAGFTDKLAKERFTVFAPTDNAVRQQLKSMSLDIENYFQDTKRVERIIKFHLIKDDTLFSKDIKEEISKDSLLSYQLDISNENDTFAVNGVAVIFRDLVADNGVLHIIERVLMPPVEYSPENPSV
jgi:transforming growth factor-beta-induced protein